MWDRPDTIPFRAMGDGLAIGSTATLIDLTKVEIAVLADTGVVVAAALVDLGAVAVAELDDLAVVETTNLVGAGAVAIAVLNDGRRVAGICRRSEREHGGGNEEDGAKHGNALLNEVEPA